MTEREWLEIFGDNLMSLIDDSRMTQNDFAEVTGISKGTISKYVNKTQMPTIKAILAISYETGEDLYDLIDFGERIE